MCRSFTQIKNFILGKVSDRNGVPILRNGLSYIGTWKQKKNRKKRNQNLVCMCLVLSCFMKSMYAKNLSSVPFVPSLPSLKL